MPSPRRARNRIQRRRLIDDQQFMGDFAGKIEFSEIESRLLESIGNPLMSAYWKIVRPLIRW